MKTKYMKVTRRNVKYVKKKLPSLYIKNCSVPLSIGSLMSYLVDRRDVSLMFYGSSYRIDLVI